MPKLMYISTSHTKGIYGTAIVQCAAACKWLQSGSGQVDAGLVDACVNQPRDAPTLVKSSCRELQGTPGMCMRDRPVLIVCDEPFGNSRPGKSG